MIEAIFGGYFTALSLILAIGAQNAFVLRQGLRREYIGMVVAICALSDAALIGAGVAGFGAISQAAPWFSDLMLWAGVAFLLFYGAQRFRAALRGGEALRPAAGQLNSRRQVALTCLLLTWANPHVYLDTLVLIGSVSARYAPQQIWFGIAAASASLSFFAALGFGARLLAPLFARPRAWVWLELATGSLMWVLAAGLAFS